MERLCRELHQKGHTPQHGAKYKVGRKEHHQVQEVQCTRMHSGRWGRGTNRGSRSLLCSCATWGAHVETCTCCQGRNLKTMWISCIQKFARTGSCHGRRFETMKRMIQSSEWVCLVSTCCISSTYCVKVLNPAVDIQRNCFARSRSSFVRNNKDVSISGRSYTVELMYMSW